MELSVAVADDVKLNVRRWPGGDVRPFLLVHGLGSNARLWDEVADLLAAAGHPVYAVDLRGHGQSDAPEGGYDNPTAVADLVAVCAGLGLDRVLVAGHSWGGNVVLRLAAEHSDLVRGLVLVDGWIDLTDTWNGAKTWEECAPVMAAIRPETAGATAEGMRAFLRVRHPGWSSRAIEASLADMRVEPDGSLSPRLSTEQFMCTLRSMWDQPPTRWYPEVTMPVMLLNATPEIIDGAEQEALAFWDRCVRRWAASAAAGIPHAESRWYPDTDHNLPHERPGQVAGDLIEFGREVG